MAKSRLTLYRGLLMVSAAALELALIAAPAGGQTTGTALSTSALGMAASAGKSETAGAGTGPVVVPEDFAALRIEPGDLLSVSVYDSPDLTASYRVDPAGNLAIPLCGEVRVRGLTMPEAAKRLETALTDNQILLHPQVNVDVLQYAGQYVVVSGEVVRPGQVALIGPERLSEVLAEVGGLTPLASTRIEISHGAGASSGDSTPNEEISYSRTHNNAKADAIVVRPGDTIVVPRAGIVYVLGAVNRPGGYLMQEDGKLNVAEALALAGGTVLQANTGGLRVIRRNADGTVLDFPLSYNAIAKGTQTPLALKARDIVYVPMSKIKASLSSASGIISAAASAAIVTR